MSVGMGFKRIGTRRLLMRSERAAHVMWQRGEGAIIDVKGQRSAMADARRRRNGDIDLGSGGDIPYAPGRETLWIASDMAKADVSENEIIHPLARAPRRTTPTSRAISSFQLRGASASSCVSYDPTSAAEVECGGRLALVRRVDCASGARGVSDGAGDGHHGRRQGSERGRANHDDDIPRWLNR